MGMAASSAAVIGIIGGSGLYQIDGLTDIAWRRVATPFGEPSDELCFGTLGGQRGGVPAAARARPPHPAVGDQLPRQHRRAEARRRHRPHLAVRRRLAARGAAARRLRARRPVHRPHLRAREELLRHRLRRACVDGASGLRRGSATRSPRRRTRPGIADDARRHLRRAWRGRNSRPSPRASSTARWGCDVIGMTNMPEAKLAREAELCYATVAMVTDFDCWHPDHDDVTVEHDPRRAARQCRPGARAGEGGGAAARPATRGPAARAAIARSTTRSSPRRRCAIPRSSPSSMRWPAARSPSARRSGICRDGRIGLSCKKTTVLSGRGQAMRSGAGAYAFIVAGMLSMVTPVMAAEPLPRAKPEDVGMSSERLARHRQGAQRRDRARPACRARWWRSRARASSSIFEAFGYRDKAAGAPMTTDAIFNIASMTKPMIVGRRAAALRAGQAADGRSAGEIFSEVRRHARSP